MGIISILMHPLQGLLVVVHGEVSVVALKMVGVTYKNRIVRDLAMVYGRARLLKLLSARACVLFIFDV